MSAIATRWLSNEWRLLRFEAVVWLTAFAAVVLAAFAIAAGARWLEQRASETSAALAEADRSSASTLARLEQIEAGTLDPASAPAVGLPTTVKSSTVLPPGPLAAFSIGPSELHPARASITAVGRLEDVFRFYQVDNPQGLATGRFDLAFVIVFLAPLIVIALTFNVLSADRDGGTLGLILSQPITARRLAWTRAGLRTALIAIGLALATIAGYLAVHPDAPPARVAAWLAITFLYLGLWGAVAVFIAGFNRSSDFNLLTLLSVWLAVTLVVPALANLVAQTVTPTPSRLEYVNALRSAEIAANAGSRELLRGYLLDHPEIEARDEGRVAPFLKTYYLVQRNVEQATAPVRAEFDQQFARQQSLLGTLAYLSPAMLMQKSLDDLAGSSLARQRRFEHEVFSLRSDFKAAVEPALMSGRRLTAGEYAALPRYRFVEEPTARVAGRLAAPAGALLAYLLVVALLANRQLRDFRPAGSD